MFVVDIVDNQIRISGWFRVPQRYTVVCCIDQEQFFYALFLLVLLLFLYLCNYVLLQSWVGQWCAGLSNTKSHFLGNMKSVHVQCLLRYYLDKNGILEIWWNIHPSKGWCAVPLYILMFGPCGDVFSWLFSRIIYKQPDSSVLGVPYLKQLLGVVGVSIMSSLLVWCCLSKYICRPE